METITYMTSLLTFYLKGEISSEQNFISFKTPNTILGLIPLGAKKERFTINQISSTASNFKLRIGKLILGLFIALIGLSSFGDSLFSGLIVLLIGANTVINAFEIDLIVTTTSGVQKPISFLILEKDKATLAENQINAMISNRLDDTNSRQQTDRIVEAINNK